MAARRCSTCGVNFPTSKSKCLGCGGKLDTLYNDQADKDWLSAAFECYMRTQWPEKRTGPDPDSPEGLEAVKAEVREIRRLEELL